MVIRRHCFLTDAESTMSATSGHVSYKSEGFIAKAATVMVLAVLLVPSPRFARVADADADERDQALSTLSERARKIHAEGMLWDGHNDLPWRLRTEGDMALSKYDLSKRLNSGQT